MTHILWPGPDNTGAGSVKVFHAVFVSGCRALKGGCGSGISAAVVTSSSDSPTIGPRLSSEYGTIRGLVQSKENTGTHPSVTSAASFQEKRRSTSSSIRFSLQKMIQELKEPDMFISFPREVVSGYSARGGGALTLRKEISGNRDEAATRNRHQCHARGCFGRIFTTGMGFTGHLRANTSEVT